MLLKESYWREWASFFFRNGELRLKFALRSRGMFIQTFSDDLLPRGSFCAHAVHILHLEFHSACDCLQERLQAVRRCDEVIAGAVRLSLASVVQAGCATQWNLCLPLLQPKLRHHVRRYLTAAADALENISRFVLGQFSFFRLLHGKSNSHQLAAGVNVVTVLIVRIYYGVTAAS
jgi:hypothetical protein